VEFEDSAGPSLLDMARIEIELSNLLGGVASICALRLS
jgi:hypothetical protein